jgi:23S rRNA (guanine2445-N2)-methyltransferase / 23S rRNA (guanine2069-N7)-methyltransferase
MSTLLDLFATSPHQLEPVLADELRALGAEQVEPVRAGVRFRGTLELAYRACLWSRSASRVLLPLASFPVRQVDDLYQGVAALPWLDHLGPDSTLAVDCVGAELPPGITNSHFAALRVKDAVVDALRRVAGRRPSIDRERPDLRLNVLLKGGLASLRVDLSGESLHRRHYRTDGGRAPLKENLAAALLLLAGWPDHARAGRAFLDPMCGSGTLPIEAGMIAADLAPGLLRDYFGFLGWRGHDPEAWRRARQEAEERARARPARLPPIVGYDADPGVVKLALGNVERARLRGVVHIERRALASCAPPRDGGGLLLVNPPYGHRIGELEALLPLYTSIGDLLKQRFVGWDAFVLTGDDELARYLGLRAVRRHVVFNGTIECRLLHYPIVQGSPERRPRPSVDGAGELAPPEPQGGDLEPIDELPDADEEPLEPRAERTAAAEMFANRLRKNLRHIGRWARRERIDCYRVYDADLPEYAVAIDRYESRVHVQEYAPPRTVDAAAARRRLRQILSVIPGVLGVSPADLFLKVRRRQRGPSQYGKLQTTGALHEVHEGGCRFLVNLSDYLDTGLFLDHRLTRALIGELAARRRFLNLFAYTGTATVYAARGGASSTTTVDLSSTYLEWARRNLQLNGVSGRQHETVRADCLDWIKTARDRYGLIFLDPPTFSNSKSMDGTFDVQRDHAWLLRATARLLTPDGILIFSTNAQRFKLDADVLGGLQIEEISAATLPRDFARNPKIHRTWRITLGAAAPRARGHDRR